MTPHALAHTLATSLVNTAWSQASLEACLLRRLPQQQQSHATQIAAACLVHWPGQVAPDARRLANGITRTAPLRALWDWCCRHNVWPAADLTTSKMLPTAPFDRLNLPELTTTKRLADWLALPHDRLAYFADTTGRHAAHPEFAVNHYITGLIPKTKGGARVIEAPKPQLKSLQRKILYAVLDQVPIHNAAYGFAKGRDCRQAAQQHAGEAMVLRFDLLEFFPTITAHRVFGLFRNLGYPHAVAELLAGLATTRTPLHYRAGLPSQQAQRLAGPHLPQGAPSSPALANLVAYALDRRLAGLARRLEAQYTRYADDMVFSGDRGIAAPLLKAVPKIARDEGFAVNPAKTRVMPSSTRQQITGLVINSHINTPRAAYDQLRATLHRCRQPQDRRLADPAFRSKIEGQIAWIASVSPNRGAKLYAALDIAVTPTSEN